jgi:hypothetical protein
VAFAATEKTCWEKAGKSILLPENFDNAIDVSESVIMMND